MIISHSVITVSILDYRRHNDIENIRYFEQSSLNTGALLIHFRAPGIATISVMQRPVCATPVVIRCIWNVRIRCVNTFIHGAIRSVCSVHATVRVHRTVRTVTSGDATFTLEYCCKTVQKFPAYGTGELSDEAKCRCTSEYNVVGEYDVEITEPLHGTELTNQIEVSDAYK